MPIQQNTLGTRLATARKQRGWTQEQLAAVAEMTQKDISRLEHRHGMHTYTLTRLALALDVRTDYLLGLED